MNLSSVPPRTFNQTDLNYENDCSWSDPESASESLEEWSDSDSEDESFPPIPSLSEYDLGKFKNSEEFLDQGKNKENGKEVCFFYSIEDDKHYISYKNSLFPIKINQKNKSVCYNEKKFYDLKNIAIIIDIDRIEDFSGFVKSMKTNSKMIVDSQRRHFYEETKDSNRVHSDVDLIVKALTEKLASLKPPKLKWLTGSKYSALPIIKRLEIPALVPTGKLLKKNLAPLCGECRFGISRIGINRIALSGVRLTDVNSAIRYAKRKHDIFSPKKAGIAIQDFYNKEPSEENLNDFMDNIYIVKLNVLRLLITGQKHEAYEIYKQGLQAILEKFSNSDSTDAIKLTRMLDKIILLFDKIKPLDFSENEKKIIKSNIPIVWASTTLKPEGFAFGTQGEVIIKGNARLGIDLQYAFTKERYIEEVSKDLEPYNIKVMDIKLIKFMRSLKNYKYSRNQYF